LCVSREQAEEVKALLAGGLAPRGLAFNEDKTRIVHLDDGFDFLGFNIRRYRGKLLIKPSKAALRRHRERLAAEMKALRGANVLAVIKRLNPIIRGWSAYYRTAVSSEAFAKLDHYLWALTYKWAKHSHSNKPKNWVINRYFGEFNKSRRDRWVLGDRDSGEPAWVWWRLVRLVFAADSWSADSDSARPRAGRKVLGGRSRSGAQVLEGNRLLAAGAQPAGADPPAERVAVFTPPRTEVTLLARGALIDGGVRAEYRSMCGERLGVAGPPVGLLAGIGAEPAPTGGGKGGAAPLAGDYRSIVTLS
jgi:hypothetical protein